MSSINAALITSTADVEAGSKQNHEVPITLTWRGVSAFVQKGAKKDGLEQILFDACGEARPGEILAVMGPSGAGKTTLLNLLADRPALGDNGKSEGTFCINGLPLPQGWKRSIGYSMQKDIFFEKLTVADHLRCTAACRLPLDWTTAQRQQEFDRIVSLLRLDKVLNTRVGSGTERGLSGGELKRLNIATELLSRPRLLFMDEPFTGLDSSLAMTVLGALRDIASTDQTAVVITVHQPSSAMWEAFDALLLMAPGGRVAFHGRCDAAASFFDGVLGRPCPVGWSPPDFYVDVVTNEESRQAVTDAWAAKPAADAPVLLSPLTPRQPPPLSVAVPALFRRQLKQVKRQYLAPMEVALTLFLASIFGFLWWQIGRHRTEPNRQSDYISILFFFIAQYSWAPLFQVINNFPDEREVLTRERASDSYSIGAWYLSKMFAELPFSWVLPAGFFLICVPLTWLPIQSVPALFAIILLNVEVSCSVGTLIAASLFDRTKAVTCAICFMVFVMCAGGYFVNLSNVPEWVGGFRYVSYWYYSMGLFVSNALPTAEDRAAFEGNGTLERYSFSSFSFDGKWGYDVLVLLGFALVHRTLAYAALCHSKMLRFN